MPQGTQALAILLVLLPGFLAGKIVEACCARPKRSELERIIEALLFSFLAYIPYAVIFHSQLPVEWTSHGNQSFVVEIKPGHLALLAGCAISLGVIWSWIVTQDKLHSILRAMHLTQRSSRVSVWADTFHELGGTVEVILGDGRVIIGWLRSYSDDADESTLFIEHAHWVHEDKLIPVEGQGVLLTKEAKIQLIMFRG